MKRENGLQKWASAVEVFLVRLTATSLALTVAAQLLLANPSLRPLLNFAHRAEGVRIDPGAAGAISVDATAFGPAVARHGVASMTLEVGDGGGAGPVVIEVDGRTLGTISRGRGLRSTITVEVTGNTEVVLRLQGAGEFSRVVVAGSSAEVVSPARGSEFLVTAGGCRFRPKIAAPGTGRP